MPTVVPINIKRKMGNPGKRKLPEEIIPPSGMPTPPVHLDDYALEEWNRLADGLHHMGVLSVVDQGAFAACCEAYSDWRHAAEEMNKVKNEQSVLDSMVQYTHNGNQIQQTLVGVKMWRGINILTHVSILGCLLCQERKWRWVQIVL